MLTILLLSLLPHSSVAVDRCDLIERNHLYDKQGRLLFTQLIFWEWSDEHADFIVRDWRMDKGATIHISSDGVRLTWLGRGVLRTVHASQYSETWTQADPELIDRKRHPKRCRRELVAP